MQLRNNICLSLPLALLLAACAGPDNRGPSSPVAVGAGAAGEVVPPSDDDAPSTPSANEQGRNAAR